MNKRHYILPFLLLVLFCLPNLLLANDAYVTNIETKVFKTDSSGDVWFGIKATVKNLGHKDDEIYVALQAIDREGFELNDITLHGNIKAGESRDLTVKTYMPYEEFKNIYKWQVK